MTEGQPGSGAGTAARIASVLLVSYAALFIVLSVDILVRVWDWRARAKAIDVLAIFFFEISRSVVTLIAIALVIYMIVRRDAPRWRPLMLAIAFAAIWHTKAFGFAAFPGELQEAVAIWLRARRVPQVLLTLAFASPAWALWGALAALVRFSVVYPQPLTARQVISAGGADREGMMRGSAVAGADVGDVMRRLSAWLLRRGALAPRALIALTIAWSALFQITGHYVAMKVVAAFVMAIVAGVVITSIRATAESATSGVSRDFIRRLGLVPLVGVTMFALSAAASALLRDKPFVGVVLLGLAPAAAAACLLYAVVRADEP